jgi:hypothetical protein
VNVLLVFAMFVFGDLIIKQLLPPIDPESQTVNEPDHIGLVSNIEPSVQESAPHVEYQDENIGHKRLDVSDEVMQSSVETPQQ